MDCNSFHWSRNQSIPSAQPNFPDWPIHFWCSDLHYVVEIRKKSNNLRIWPSENCMLAIVMRAEQCPGPVLREFLPKVSDGWFGNAVGCSSGGWTWEWDRLVIPKGIHEWVKFTYWFGDFKVEVGRKRVAWWWGLNRVLAVWQWAAHDLHWVENKWIYPWLCGTSVYLFELYFHEFIKFLGSACPCAPLFKERFTEKISWCIKRFV